MPSFDAIVIGAGFAGLAAAVDLTGRGAHVLVLEAKSRLGGRATAFQDHLTGELVDNGQHVLFGCYVDTFRFLRTIGAEQNVHLQASLAVEFIDSRGRRTRLRCPPLPAPLHLVAGVLEWESLPPRDRLRILKLLRPLRRARRRPGQIAQLTSPGESVEQWLAVNGQTDALRELLWEPLALAAMNQAPGEAAAPPFIRVLAEMFSEDPISSAIGMPRKPLHLMYAEPARAFIETAGGEVRTSAAALIELPTSGNPLRVHTRGEQILTTSVIAAVPWHALPSLFVSPQGLPSELGAIVANAGAMASSPIVTVNLWFNQPVLDAPFIGLPGRAMQWVFDKRAAFGEQVASHLSLASSGAGALVHLSNDEVIGLARRLIVDAIPAARTATLTRATVIRERHATFSMAAGQPPRPRTQSGVPGLLLAGDWIDTGLPGTIESAVRSGHWAAAEVGLQASGGSKNP